MTIIDQIAVALGVSVIFVVFLLLWSTLWKCISLWRAGRNNHPVWFVLLFFLNTLGLLPIIYLLFFQPRKKVVKRKIRRHVSKI